MSDSSVLNLTKVAAEDLAKEFEIEENLYERYLPEILNNTNLQQVINTRSKIGDWRENTPLGAPGTILNGILLYCLIRHYNIENILETGVSGGFYTSFIMAAYEHHVCARPAYLTSLEISSDATEVGKLIPTSLKKKIKWWNLILGEDSINYFKKRTPPWETPHQLYCHDSLHTMSHMMKEFMCFKKSSRSRFFIFIDDQNSDNFWIKLLQTKAYTRPGYDVKYISGNESRLRGHMGGFLKYEKS